MTLNTQDKTLSCLCRQEYFFVMAKSSVVVNRQVVALDSWLGESFGVQMALRVT